MGETMLVYGDVKRSERADALCAAIAAELGTLERRPPGLERHAALVGVLLKAGGLVQGLSDAEFGSAMSDELSAPREIGGTLLLDLAQLVVRSWRQGFAGRLAVPSRTTALLAKLRTPLSLDVKQPEGYAFYGLYPESYAEAAMRSGLRPDTIVIGIRTIGTSLAAVVAAALGAAAPVTLRPTGHPFRRRIAVGPRLSRHLLGDRTADFAIVDEGPGLSGSSFGCVADWLEEHGVSRKRIHFFPGHRGGLGPESSHCHRQRWANGNRHVVDFDELLLGTECPLASWVSELVGALERPLEDVSAGAWRSVVCGDRDPWPPADRRFERRKFLAHTRDGQWLVKFAGLGDIGERKLDKARLLAEAGFTPPVAGLCHGFLVQKWVPARPLTAAEFRRAGLIRHLGHYLAFRARHLPAPVTRGASVSELCAMAVMNTEEALGASAAARLKPRLRDAGRYDASVLPVDSDNRLHRWEWLVAGEQRLLKADALDHSGGHDLVGCQDIAWDVAGASVELDLSGDETAELRSIVSDGCARAVDAELQAILEICYLTFQLGLWISARSMATDEESRRLDAMAARYATLLRGHIAGVGSV